MFNIPDSLEIIGLEKTGCKKSHIVQCVSDHTKHDRPKFDYFGTHVARGTVVLHTKNGDFTLAFDEKDGGARRVEIL